jgi:hypothetical protein
MFWFCSKISFITRSPQSKIIMSPLDPVANYAKDGTKELFGQELDGHKAPSGAPIHCGM